MTGQPVADRNYQETMKHILSSVCFHEGPSQQITLSVPIGNADDHMKFIISPTGPQIVIDVFVGGKFAFSGITAKDMRVPMCPVYKH
jgi:hypothetical protein